MILDSLLNLTDTKQKGDSLMVQWCRSAVVQLLLHFLCLQPFSEQKVSQTSASGRFRAAV